MAKREKQEEGKKKGFYRFIVVLISLALVCFILDKAPNYIKSSIADKTNLVINNSNVTKSLKSDVIVKDNIVYLSKEDVENYFDGSIYYDSKYNQIITTSDTKVAVLPVNNKNITINGSNMRLYASIIEENNKYYIPFSEISKSVFNVETKVIKDTNTVVLESLDRELTYANSSKKNSVKYDTTIFSKTVDKIGVGDTVKFISTDDGWTKVLTENGKIGYVKENSLENFQKVRDDLVPDKQIEGKVSMVWDYFYEQAKVPELKGRMKGTNVIAPTFFVLKESGKGELLENVGTDGINYIRTAHNSGYKVWSMISNNSMKDTTSEILNDYELRNDLIENIVDKVVRYNLDGVDLDFENMYEKDKHLYSRLIIELAPRLRDIGKVLSVDVTAPDGAPEWSLCFDRNEIAKAADYIIFMGYDQYGESSKEPGTTAGYNWVEANLQKFLKQEEVPKEKLILGMPFYTRIWRTVGDKSDSQAISMKSTYSRIPNDVTPQWLSDVKQNYITYKQGDTIYKMWIEDTKSISEKFNLLDKYELAGAAYWRKDMASDDIWDVVSERLNVK